MSRTVTYPPELLPSPDEDDEADVIVVDPDTGRQTVVFSTDEKRKNLGVPGKPHYTLKQRSSKGD